jgi:nucleoside-diphosphate-sugar epimerase
VRELLARCRRQGARARRHAGGRGARPRARLVGHNPSGGPSDETFTVNPFETHLEYDLSKGIAELEVHRAVHRGLDVRIVNPCGVVGAHDYKPSSVGQTILDFAIYVSNFFLGAFAPNRPPRITPGTIRLLNGGKHADIGKARNELGFAPTPVLDAFTEAFEWFKARGQIRS